MISKENVSILIMSYYVINFKYQQTFSKQYIHFGTTKTELKIPSFTFISF